MLVPALGSNMFLLSLLVLQQPPPAYARSFTADGGQTVAGGGCGRHLVSSPGEKRGESSPRRARCSDHQSLVSLRANLFDPDFAAELIVAFRPPCVKSFPSQ